MFCFILKNAPPLLLLLPQTVASATSPAPSTAASLPTAQATPAKSVSGDSEIIEMDRMRKLIVEHMVMSKRTSPHVTSYVEADVTNIVMWRNKVKDQFEKREKEKITFTPIFIEAIRHEPSRIFR